MSAEKKNKIDIGNIRELTKMKKAGQDQMQIDQINEMKAKASSISKGLLEKIKAYKEKEDLEIKKAEEAAVKETAKSEVKAEVETPAKEVEVKVETPIETPVEKPAEVKTEKVEEKPIEKPVEEKPVIKTEEKKEEKSNEDKPAAPPKYTKVIQDNRGDRSQKPYNNNRDKDPKNQQNNNRNNNNHNGQNPNRKPFDPNKKNQFNKTQGANDTNRPPYAKGNRNNPKPTDINVLPTDIGPKPGKKQNPQQQKKKVIVEDKKAGLNKRTLLKKGYITDETLINNDEYTGRKAKKKEKKQKVEAIKITHAVVDSEVFAIKTLAEKIGKTSVEIVKQLFTLGMMKGINDDISFDEAELVANELGVELEYIPAETFEDKLDQIAQVEDDDENLQSRPPVVTIMGHVDHGKTTLLDYIRKANVASGEAGGITQHIGAYTAKVNDRTITFLDTPGHEAFTSMRLRGAQATDVAIIVVAADDGIMPQTVEAINHAKIAGVEIVIAITKCDKPEANPDRILQQLTEHDLLPEAWGGSTPVCKVSGKTGEGVNELLETVLLVADLLELKANPDRLAKGIIIEAKLDKGRGPVATVLVQNGTLHVGDYVVAGTTSGKIRAMFNSKAKAVKVAGPSTPVSVLGFSDVPTAGDQLIAVEDEKLAKQVVKEREDKIKLQQRSTVKMNLEDMFKQIQDGELKELKLIVKADVQGSVEAVTQSMEKLSNDEVTVKVIHGAAGAVNESDVMLAETAGAIIIAFNVRPDNNAKSYAEKKEINIRTYRVIYDAIEDVEKAMKGMLAPQFKEVVYGTAEIRNTFKVSNVGTVGGCMVLTGKVVRNSKLRLVRDGVIITEGEISSLKRFKDDVKEVAKGYECGLGIEGFNDIKVGDIIESYNMEQIVNE